MFQEIETKRVLIFGCGNVLLGDDGFGPAVIERLRQRGDLPDDAHAEDVGTSIRGLLFDIVLKERGPERIIVLDAVDRPGRRPGEVFEIPVDEIPERKIVDYSFHQFPTTNLLQEIQEERGIRVTVVAAQVAAELAEVGLGLSAPMRAAVAAAAERVVALAARDP